MTIPDTFDPEALLAYLDGAGGRDVLECTDAVAARQLALDLRRRLAGTPRIAVEQHANQVVLVRLRQPARL